MLSSFEKIRLDWVKVLNRTIKISFSSKQPWVIKVIPSQNKIRSWCWKVTARMWPASPPQLGYWSVTQALTYYCRMAATCLIGPWPPTCSLEDEWRSDGQAKALEETEGFYKSKVHQSSPQQTSSMAWPQINEVRRVLCPSARRDENMS